MNFIFSSYSLYKNGQKIYKGIRGLKIYKNINNNMYMDLVSSTKKERSDMILEPLQVMVQLSLLAHSPVGTKVSVSDNILQIQRPTLFQGVWRWYNSDGKDDLYYLFHAIRRYYKWYKSDNNRIFNYILAGAIKGLAKLIVTYSAIDQTAITHTLSLYKNVLELESPDLFKDPSEDAINIDSVFQNIKSIYDKKLLKIIYNTLLLLEEPTTTEDEQKCYLNGLLSMLAPVNNEIRKWIREKLTC
tara:strand:+ start:1627 stop:2358 length:732 start_codon:yes stop_codon:yes gene_type:complete